MPAPLGRRHLAPGYRLVVGVGVGLVGTALAIVAAALVAGGERGRFAVALTMASALVAVPLGRVIVAGVRLDFDGRHLTSRDLRGRRRVRVADVEEVRWPPDAAGWVAPELVVRGRPPVRLGALTRIEMGRVCNTAAAHLAVASLTAELDEASRRQV